MKIKVIDFGYKKLPYRAHDNDAGADVHALHDVIIYPHSVEKIPLGLGLCLPDGYAAFVFPRSGLSSQGIIANIPPIDSGYRGEIHAIVSNNTDRPYHVETGARIGQLVVLPVVIPDYVTERGFERGDGAFGSTGK